MGSDQLHVFAYDIAKQQKRNRAAETLLDYGERVGLSLFECRIKPGLAQEVLARLKEIINPETDRVNLYRICGNCERSNDLVGGSWRGRAAKQPPAI